MSEKKEFQPYIPASKVTPELTITSIIMGILLAVIFGAANAYLGLRIGMTVSASIPAAVIAMGVIRVLMRKNSILESNMAQTIGSAGESLAAGTIFTLPALFLWANEGKVAGLAAPSFLEVTCIALIGGLLGVFFMIPLRNALIVREHNTLPYPEGKACAEVMLAGEEGGSNAGTVFAGMGIAAAFKFILDGLGLFPGEVNWVGSKKSYPGAVGFQTYPALLSVGFICGPRIASYMFAGGILSWMVIIPMIFIFGGMDTFNLDVANTLWDEKIRYIGAGALVAGGIISLVKSFPVIVRAFGDSMKGSGKKEIGVRPRTDNDISMKIVLVVIIALTLAVWLVPFIPVGNSFTGLLAAAIVVVFGFFFATVSSRMVGMVGSSNNPVSGMAVATILASTIIMKNVFDTDAEVIRAVIAIGSIICIIAAISGDTSQDLKTGYLLGATPKKQQIGEIIGVTATALTMGGTLWLLNEGGGFGKAPQATLMKTIVDGILGGDLPWSLIIIGVVIAVVVELIGIPVLPFAIGIYLPVQMNACIMVGGIIRLFFDKMKNADRKEKVVNRGILFSSGMIAGEGLVGILLAVLTIAGVFGKNSSFAIANFLNLPAWSLTTGSIVLFAALISIMLVFTIWKKDKKSK